MAERSKALRSGRSLVLQAWVRIPLLTITFHSLVYQSTWSYITSFVPPYHDGQVKILCIISTSRECSANVNISSPYAVMAEWLRRQTRNLLGSARAGSNPADCARWFCLCY